MSVVQTCAFSFFFFQAEDGIRDLIVTGVQTCALPILANIFAARGYEVISIQHDLPTDPPMVTKIGEPFVGRLAQIQRGVANIKFAVAQMREARPNADYDHLTMVGHSMGGDITMYFAKQYPEEI